MLMGALVGFVYPVPIIAICRTSPVFVLLWATWKVDEFSSANGGPLVAAADALSSVNFPLSVVYDPMNAESAVGPAICCQPVVWSLTQILTMAALATWSALRKAKDAIRI